MNIYFLVEGRRTERKVYPRWLSHLLPGLRQVERFDAVTERNYFLFSGEGYPGLLRVHLPNAVEDVNKVGRYDYLVVCLDADEATRDQRAAEVHSALANSGRTLKAAELRVVIQNRCIETWFLGNPRIVTRAAQSPILVSYLHFYDVTTQDPETMGVFPGFRTHATFHGAYLKEAFREKNLTYTKQYPGHVCDPAYLDQLMRRVQTRPTDLASFQAFLDFCEELRGRMEQACSQ